MIRVTTTPNGDYAGAQARVVEVPEWSEFRSTVYRVEDHALRVNELEKKVGELVKENKEIKVQLAETVRLLGQVTANMKASQESMRDLMAALVPQAKEMAELVKEVANG